MKAPIVNGKDYLEDIAALSGAKLISSELGHTRLEACDPVYFMGKCDKI